MDGVQTLILVMVTLLLIIAIVAAVGVWIVALRWRRTSHGRQPRRRRPASSQPAAPPSATAGPPSAPMPGMSAGRPKTTDAEPVAHGDVPADDPRIVALGLEEPTSAE